MYVALVTYETESKDFLSRSLYREHGELQIWKSEDQLFMFFETLNRPDVHLVEPQRATLREDA